MKLSLLVAGLPLLLLAACAASSDDGTSSANDVVVNPSGTDQPGSIMVALPANLSAAMMYYQDAQREACVPGILVDGKLQPVSQLLGNLPVGTHTVTVNGDTQSVDVTSGQTTTITLGARTYTLPGDPTFGLTVAGKPSESGTPYRSFSVNDCGNWVPSNGQVFASLPGTFSASWGFGDGTAPFTVTSGQTTTVDLGDTTGRRLVRLHAPSRATQSVRASGAPDPYERGLWWVSEYEASEQAVVDEPTGTLVIGTRDPAQSIFVHLPFTNAARAMTLTQDGLSEQTIARIDVTNVAVAQSGGTTQSYPGFWSLQAQDPSVTFNLNSASDFVNGGVETDQGLDVWPGTYTIWTSYTTTEAGGKTTSQTVDAEN